MQLVILTIKKNPVLLIYLLAVIIRFSVILQGDVFFYFDQARDAAISQRIYQQSDLKIQGPSVSGTNDSVYHGVLYYYLIGLLYTLGDGSPQFASIVLALIGSIGVIVTYYLGSEIFKSRTVGLVAAFLLAVSAVSTHQHIWLSNPQLNSVFLPMVYLLSWKVFFLTKKPSTNMHSWVLLGILVACSVQAALQSIVLLPTIMVILAYTFYQQPQLIKKYIVHIGALGLSFFLGISSMLLTELLLWKNGILSLSNLNLEEHSASIFSNLWLSFLRYVEISHDLFATEMHWLLGICLVFPLLIAVRALEKKQLVWLILFSFAPLWLLLWHFRDPIHTFIGFELLFYLLASYGGYLLWQYHKWQGLVAGLMLISIFIFSQLSALHNWHTTGRQYYGIQRGALLHQQLELIDTMYTHAQGQPFSFSTLTSPYAINSTWSYLVSWRSANKYSYQPTYFGMPQAGYPGEYLLPEDKKVVRHHFTIIEPDTTLSDQHIHTFLLEQDAIAGTSTEEWMFGTLILQMRSTQ